MRTVTAKPPKPVKLRRQGVMVAAIVRLKSTNVATPTIVRPVTAKQRRWNAMREQMGLEP
jgi:hypothetical protein